MASLFRLLAVLTLLLDWFLPDTVSPSQALLQSVLSSLPAVLSPGSAGGLHVAKFVFTTVFEILGTLLADSVG